MYTNTSECVPCGKARIAQIKSSLRVSLMFDVCRRCVFAFVGVFVCVCVVVMGVENTCSSKCLKITSKHDSPLLPERLRQAFCPELAHCALTILLSNIVRCNPQRILRLPGKGQKIVAIVDTQSQFY